MRTGKMAVAGQYRNAWLPPAGSSFSVEVEVPGPAELQVSFALRAEALRQEETEIDFRLTAAADGVPETLLLSEGLKASWSVRDGWCDRTVALPGPPGGRLTLRLSTASMDPRWTDMGALQPAWSYPRLLEGERDAGPDARPNLVLVSLDDLRPDHVGVYGHTRPTTPALDALARSGAWFTQAVAHSTWTTPSHASLLASLLPTTHGLTAHPDDLAPGEQVQALAENWVTLAEALREAGYDTAAFTGGATMAALSGFRQGFEVYDEGLGSLTPASAARVDAWLSRRRHRPFFLLLHTYEVHGPYTSERFLGERRPCPVCSPLQQELELNLLRYDGDVRTADDYLGRLVARLEELGLRDRTLLVVVSDHGEEFGDHDPAAVSEAHGHTLYDELLRVVLVVSPGRVGSFPAGRRVDAPVRLLDVMPTVLELAGVQTPEQAQGRSLVPLLRGKPLELPPAVAELSLRDRDLRALRTGRWKYLQTTTPRPVPDLALVRSPRQESLYDLAKDPGERHDLCASQRSRCDEMRELLAGEIARALAARRPPQSADAPPELLERLRALGYAR